MTAVVILLTSFGPADAGLPAGVLKRIGAPHFRHTGSVERLTASAVGGCVAGLTRVGDIRVWDNETGRTLADIPAGRHRPMSNLLGCFRFTPDGTALWHAAPDQEGRISLYRLDWRAGKRERLLRLTADGPAILSADGRRLVARAGKEHFEVHDVDRGRRLAARPVGEKWTLMALDAGGHRLLLGNEETRRIQVTDLDTGRAIYEADWPGDTFTRRAALSPDGRRLAIGHRVGKSRVELIDVDAGRVLRRFGERPPTGIWFSPDGSRLGLALSRGSQSIDVHRVADGRRLTTVPAVLMSPNAADLCVTWAADNRWLATAAYECVSVWDAETGVRLGRPPLPAEMITPMDWLRWDEPKRLIGGFDDHTVEWDPSSALSTGGRGDLYSVPAAARRRIAEAADPKTHAQFTSHGGTWAVTVSRSRERPREFTLFDAMTGRRLSSAKLQGPLPPLPPKRFSESGPRIAWWRATDRFGRWLIGRGKSGNVLWSLRTGRRLAELPPDAAGHYFASPTGRRVAAVGTFWKPTAKLAKHEAHIRFYNTCTGQELSSLRNLESPTWAVAISHDGRVAAVTQGRGAIRLVDVNTGKPIRVLRGHRGRVVALAFAPDGKTLATASPDAPIFLWKITP